MRWRRARDLAKAATRARARAARERLEAALEAGKRERLAIAIDDAKWFGVEQGFVRHAERRTRGRASSTAWHAERRTLRASLPTFARPPPVGGRRPAARGSVERASRRRATTTAHAAAARDAARSIPSR